MKNEESNLLNRYEFESNENSYTFKTDYGIDYEVYFTSGEGYFEAFPEIKDEILVFGFNTKDKNRSFDPKVASTIAYILKKFLNENQKALIFMCDMLDNRAEYRKKLFNLWFKRFNQSKLQKIDYDLVYETAIVYTSIIISPLHPKANLIIQKYLETNQQFESGQK